jgi:hypothetical protein
LNDAQFHATKDYLDTLRIALSLKDWDITLLREYPDSHDAWAEIEVCETRKAAWIKVAYPEFYDSKTPEEQRSYLVHELIHCHLDASHRSLARLGEMNPDAKDVDFAKRQHRVDIEQATDALALAFAAFFPVPRLPHTLTKE